MNNHFISPDDPLLTAYALGELSPERAAWVEEALKNSPEARQAVEEIRILAADLEGALAQEALNDPIGGHAANEPVATSAAPSPGRVVPFPYVWVGTLAAACLAMVIALNGPDSSPTAVPTASVAQTTVSSGAAPEKHFVRVPNSPLATAASEIQQPSFARVRDSLLEDGRRRPRGVLRVDRLADASDPHLRATLSGLLAQQETAAAGEPPSEILPLPEDRADHRLFDDIRSKSEIAREIASRELLTFKINFKEPKVDVARDLRFSLITPDVPSSIGNSESMFAAAADTLDSILREAYGSTEYDQVISWSEAGKGEDADSRRGEFIDLVKKARALSAE